MLHFDDSQQGTLWPRRSVVVITGNYGSGKTEVAVNWALWLQRAGLQITIADLDIVNPYFRCREAQEQMSQAGIRVLAPSGELHSAELPIIMPEIPGAIQQPQGVTLLDVGGDEDGARVLSSLSRYFDDYEMLQVVNQCRPFTDTVEGCLKIQREIETSSRLKVTGLISNAHLMDETDAKIITDGAAFARAVGAEADQELRFVTMERRLEDQVDVDALESPVLVLERQMLPPWKKVEKLGSANFRLTPP
jgi:hypothetical protein